MDSLMVTDVEGADYLVTEDGFRVPVNGVRAQKMKAVVESALNRELLRAYEGDDPRYFGKTKLEVGFSKLADCLADGNISEINGILNRVLGLPKQITESANLNTTSTLAEFLEVQAKTNPPPREGVIDVS